jgi:hydrogenase nickel incorporation protein HypA/HybF
MHEMSIAQSILDIVQEYMDKENGKKLVEVAVEVGELVAVVPESLKFCYEALVDHTPFQGSKLNIKILPLMGDCLKCGHEFKIQDFTFICPKCQSSEIQTQQGQELKISYLEVE